ncbi:hypothetical protein BpHYR1_011544 [Brachionus plicatilis]|uniref:Uncharacterized protein n=1 Tax=Brachionus plicatilis TaxID=10195 RepID=A0A3M7QZ31_BRAPC|nr:hypothetical protein BpHYR1_011544 [Brachionus plicatilis]
MFGISFFIVYMHFFKSYAQNLQILQRVKQQLFHFVHLQNSFVRNFTMPAIGTNADSSCREMPVHN